MIHRVRIYPHNDLLNLAHYHHETMSKKVKNGVKDAVALDCMSCIVALAFSVEALINFIGGKCVPGWEERSPFFEKVEKVSKKHEWHFDESIEPYATIATLKNIRDQIAHGQPMDKTVRTSSKADLKEAMKTSWDNYLTPDFCNHAYMQVQSFERQLLERSGIPIEETTTSAL